MLENTGPIKKSLKRNLQNCAAYIELISVILSVFVEAFLEIIFKKLPMHWKLKHINYFWRLHYEIYN